MQLADDLLIRVCSMLGIESIHRVTSVCKRLSVQRRQIAAARGLAQYGISLDFGGLLCAEFEQLLATNRFHFILDDDQFEMFKVCAEDVETMQPDVRVIRFHVRGSVTAAETVTLGDIADEMSKTADSYFQYLYWLLPDEGLIDRIGRFVYSDDGQGMSTGVRPHYATSCLLQRRGFRIDLSLKNRPFQYLMERRSLPNVYHCSLLALAALKQTIDEIESRSHLIGCDSTLSSRHTLV